MKKLALLICIVSIALFTSNSTSNESLAGEKIVICHIPPGNPSNAHSIEVSINSLNAHLAHGDTIGACDQNNDDAADEKTHEQDLHSLD